MAVGNTHENLVKNGSWSYRQTHRQTCFSRGRNNEANINIAQKSSDALKAKSASFTKRQNTYSGRGGL